MLNDAICFSAVYIVCGYTDLRSGMVESDRETGNDRSWGYGLAGATVFYVENDIDVCEQRVYGVWGNEYGP